MMSRQIAANKKYRTTAGEQIPKYQVYIMRNICNPISFQVLYDIPSDNGLIPILHISTAP